MHEHPLYIHGMLRDRHYNLVNRYDIHVSDEFLYDCMAPT